MIPSARAGSSAVEHGTFNPLVEGSNPSRLTSVHARFWSWAPCPGSGWLFDSLAYDLADRTVSITPTGDSAGTLVLDALGRLKTRTTGSSVDTWR